jgi:hypothetical protein
MAKLSAHGIEIGRIVFNTYAKAYMSDGAVLKNNGFGWKLHARCKPGVDPVAVYERAKAHQEAFLVERPALATYRKALHRLSGLSKAWKLHAAVELMDDDPDGVWSECCNGYADNVHADIDEVSELCNLYKLAMAEMQAMKTLQTLTDWLIIVAIGILFGCLMAGFPFLDLIK